MAGLQITRINDLMTEETTPSPEQGTEAATSEAPTDFREYAAWRATGELPAKEEPATPAAAEVPEEPAPAKTEPEPEPDDDQEQETETKPGSRRTRKIEKLTRENEELRRALSGLTSDANKPAQSPESAQSAPGKPKLEDFQTLEAYQEALTDWKLDERERLQREKQAREATEQALRAEQETWAQKEKAARKAHPDYDDLMDTIQIPAGPGVLAARQAMLEDEHGAELLYYLAKHPKELAVIAALTPASAVMAIGKLSVSLTSSAAPENGKPRITGAPKPPPPSGKSSKTTSDSLDDPEVEKNFSRWERLRQAQLGRR